MKILGNRKHTIVRIESVAPNGLAIFEQRLRRKTSAEVAIPSNAQRSADADSQPIKRLG